MRFARLFLILFPLALVCSAQAQDAPAPGNNSAKTQSAPSSEQSAAKPAAPKIAVDAAKVTGSSFESQYFKFTYELPKDWKSMDDAARMASNQQLLREDAQHSTVPLPVPKKASAKTPSKTVKSAHGLLMQIPPPERYSLMAASPNGIDSLSSPVMPRINIWANRRVPPLDEAMDHAQLLITGKHTGILTPPQEILLNGTRWVRVQLVTPAGDYHSRYLIVVGDYLLGFDFWAQSEAEMVELADTIKSVKFN